MNWNGRGMQCKGLLPKQPLFYREIYLNTQNISDRKSVLITKLQSLQQVSIDDSANFKFMNLLRSRLCEEGIPLEAATQIVAHIDYDLSVVDEEDDFIGDVALAYAEFAARVYDRLKATNWHRNLSPEIVRKYFNVFKIELAPLTPTSKSVY